MAKKRKDKSGQSPGFAPVPFRACVDKVLTGFDIRIIAGVAGHDRLSLTSINSNGRGCYVGIERLAHLCNGNRSSVSSSLNKLVRLEYLAVEDHPKDVIDELRCDVDVASKRNHQCALRRLP